MQTGTRRGIIVVHLTAIPPGREQIGTALFGAVRGPKTTESSSVVRAGLLDGRFSGIKQGFDV